MIAHSIHNRLLLTLTIYVVLALALSGYALDHAFRHSAETALTEKLKAHFYTLLADSDEANGRLVMPELLSDPLFNRIDSGLYALITDTEQQPIWRSPSAIGLPRLTLPKASTGEFHLQPLPSRALYLLSYGVIWEPEEGPEQHYQIYLLQNTQALQAEVADFRTSLWRWFGAIALLLIALQSIIMRWGLFPLRKLARELGEIESGNKQQLQERYPRELEGVTHNFNVLIESERRQRQRYRDTLADLAHSLKTPLAILRGLRFNGHDASSVAEDKKSLAEQVTRMDEIVSHQLQRASAKTADTNALSMHPVALAPLADKLLRSLNKVYADKAVQIRNRIPAELAYRADERDLMEILGNLLDNAFKACRREVTLAARSTPNTLYITITDDGDGIPAELRHSVLERGSRADTRHPGQGLGLAVAKDIITSYRGNLNLEQAEPVGTRVCIELPLN